VHKYLCLQARPDNNLLDFFNIFLVFVKLVFVLARDAPLAQQQTNFLLLFLLFHLLFLFFFICQYNQCFHLVFPNPLLLKHLLIILFIITLCLLFLVRFRHNEYPNNLKLCLYRRSYWKGKDLSLIFIFCVFPIIVYSSLCVSQKFQSLLIFCYFVMIGSCSC